MNLFVHELGGCTPTPLLSYMKAVGILRLVSEQADPAARGFWKDECFQLVTQLSKEQLTEFFLRNYAPSPLLSPWNRGSGFYSETDKGLSPIQNSTAERLRSMRSGIADAHALMRSTGIIFIDAEMDALEKEQKRSGKSPTLKSRQAVAKKQYDSAKVELIKKCRMFWRGSHLDWFSAVLVIDGEGTLRYPSMFGTGGNDGRLDFTNNYYQRLQELMNLDTGMSKTASSVWLSQALWGGPVPGARARKASIGQFAPGGAGGANATTGPDGDAFVNPWNFVLMLEGGLLFTASVTRRLDSTMSPQAAAPFAVSARNAGYGSASPTEEKGRGEQWLPLWSRPVLLAEVRKLLTEGRSRLGTRNPNEPLDMVRAIARLGTARGIAAFERVGYLERNGQANLAVNLGRVIVPNNPSPNIMLLDDLDGWLDRLRLRAKDNHSPARLRTAERTLGDAVFSTAQHPDEPQRWQRLLCTLAQVERVMATGAGVDAGPIPPLQPGWLIAADDGTATWRLAVALALATDGQWRDNTHSGSVRHHWLPLRPDGRRFSTSGTLGSQRLLVGSEVVCFGRDPVRDLSAIVERRLVEAQSRSSRRLPLSAPQWATARLADLNAYLTGGVHDETLFALAQALSALDRRRLNAEGQDVLASWGRPADSDTIPDDPWLAIRLALLPPLSDQTLNIPADPAIVRRLSVGDAPGAVELALRRLHAAGIHCVIQSGLASPSVAQRWASALAFPISQYNVGRIRRRLDRSLEFLQGANP